VFAATNIFEQTLWVRVPLLAKADMAELVDADDENHRVEKHTQTKVLGSFQQLFYFLLEKKKAILFFIA
jgi:hypothetical protein